MIIGAINLSVFEIVILQIGAIILGVTVHFFVVSRRALKEAIPPKAAKAPRPGSQEVPLPQDLLQVKEKQLSRLEERLVGLQKTAGREEAPQKAAPRKGASSGSDMTDSLRLTITQQQKTLQHLLTRIDELGNEGESESLGKENEELKWQVNKLEAALEKKESELQSLRQQSSVALKMSSRIDEVYQEFESLQQKITSLERQASAANELAMELEEVREAYEQVRRDSVRKGEKLEETVAENSRLHSRLAETEDKLAEANLQRQQLLKKLQLLQDLNNDLQHMSDANKKLQTEIRRIGELESMLHMISEERDLLLRKQVK